MMKKTLLILTHFFSSSRCLSLPKLRVIMDVDECMIHSDLESEYPHRAKNGLEIKKVICMDRTVSFYCRPGLFMFLEEVSSFSQMHVMTARMCEYAMPVIRALDPEGKIFVSIRAREQLMNLSRGKDLRLLGDDYNERRTVLVDNNSYNFKCQSKNGILVRSFADDETDSQLYDVLELLRQLKDVEDVRTVLGPMRGKYPPSITRN